MSCRYWLQITSFQGGPAKVSSNIHTCFAQVPLQGPPMLEAFLLLPTYMQIAGITQQQKLRITKHEFD